MAEPDQVDFSTMTQPLWGVVEGCEISVSGSTATTVGGIAIINGAMIPINNSQVGINTGGDQDRFDLVVADVQGVIRVIRGQPDLNPVFPDPDDDATVLAAVFCPAGEGTLTEYVIDKRKFVSKALLTKIAFDAELIRNTNGGSNHFLVRGDGWTTWETDTWMWRSGEETLSVHRNLNVEANIDVGGMLATVGDVMAGGNVYGDNLHWDSVAPVGVAPGTIWQDSNTGRVYIWRNGGWQEMATVNGTVPVGTIIQSLETDTAMMRGRGWVAVNGQTINETDFAALFGLAALQPYIQAGGIAGQRTMKLPDATNVVLMQSSSPGVFGGSNQFVLKTENLPKHKHNVKTSLAGAAAPGASLTPAPAHAHTIPGGTGMHGHDVSDPGHAHHGFDLVGNASPVIALMWGGNNKIDALFNDRNHTYSVEALEWTMPAKSNIVINPAYSGHSHTMDQAGGHTHNVTVGNIPNHTHPVTEDDIGSAAPISFTPAFLGVLTYIRS
jgi:microcystin-dependent protein